MLACGMAAVDLSAATNRRPLDGVAEAFTRERVSLAPGGRVQLES